MPEVVELYVMMHCEACAASVKRAIKKIRGVESYTIDFYNQKVIVVGNVDPVDVWRRIHKTGKQVTLIPKPMLPKEESKKDEKKEEKTEEKKEKKVEEKSKVKIEENKEEKSKETKEETKVLEVKEEVKVHETKEEVVKVVEIKENKDEVKGEGKSEGKEGAKPSKSKESKKLKELEWMPMYVSAPYYTLPTTFY